MNGVREPTTLLDVALVCKRAKMRAVVGRSAVVRRVMMVGQDTREMTVQALHATEPDGCPHIACHCIEFAMERFQCGRVIDKAREVRGNP
jgi:hypothetical protein